MTAVMARARSVSFRSRLSMLVAAAVGVTVALAALASYIAVKHQLFTQADSALKAEVNTAISLSSGPRALDSGSVAHFLRQNDNSFMQFILPSGSVEPLSDSPAVPAKSTQSALVGNVGQYRIDTVRYDGVRYRVMTVGAVSLTGPVAVQIARPLTDIDHTLTVLRLILWIVTLGGIGVAVGLGLVVGRATMRPVVRLTSAAEHVAATQDLDSQIDEEGDDELARLARSFNSMLSALAVSRRQQAQLISDAGHELRTPLTSLRTNIEVLMRVRDLPESDRAELIADVQAQLQELTTLIGDVVDLAREDEQQAEPIEVRLDAIVERAVDRARRRAPLVDFALSLTRGSVRAHPTLLERAVLNVLDNAAKWSPPGGTVSVVLTRGDRWSLDIRDHGPGIAAADLPYVFDRFYRAESARSMPGSGLGLAIVRQVIDDHGGDVHASTPSDDGGGTLIHIELPIVPEHEPDDGDRVAESHPPEPVPNANDRPVTDRSVTTEEPECPERESNPHDLSVNGV